MKINENLIKVKITPFKERFYNHESSWGIYLCRTEEVNKVRLNKYNNIVIKGNTIPLNLDQEYNATLQEEYNQQYNQYQYNIKSIFEDIPDDISKQRAFLRCVITDNQVDAIYDAYPNENIIQLIKNDKFDHGKVKGIGESTYQKIKDKIINNIEYQKAYEFLSDYIKSNDLIVRLVRYYDSAGLLIQKMKENPYCIIEIRGIGFKTADEIATAMGINKESSYRIRAAIRYTVEESEKDGHTYITIDDLIENTYEIIGVDYDLIQKEIKTTDHLIVIENKVALKRNYYAEKYISETIVKLLNNSTNLNVDIDQFIEEQEKDSEFRLTDRQKEIIYNVTKYNVNLLIGPAGGGKSQTTNYIIKLLDKLHIPYRLMSPSAQAAKVMTSYTHRNAETIHRAIGLGTRKEDEGEYDIKEQFIIVDEFSMTDAITCSKLLEKCKNPNVRILFVGDASQLPSVGAGNLIHDMINSHIVPTVILDKVFRQSEGGSLDIITKIRKGEKFLDNNFWGIKKFGEDCIVVSVPQEKMVDGYKYYLKEFLKKYNSDDITIVTPTKKGELGTSEINKQIQSIVNPEDEHKNSKKYGKQEIIFREDDYVLNIKNDYKIKNIFDQKISIVNGDTGKIDMIDDDAKDIIIDFGFGSVPISYDKLNQIIHAWCMTIHKMQGSANKVIIVIADKSNKFTLNRNLLYTGASRVREFLIILSQAETINYALKKQANLQRNTFLMDMLINN